MTGNNITHESHDALIGQWPASAGHSCAWRPHRHPESSSAGRRWRSGSGCAVMDSAIRHARTRGVAATTGIAHAKSP
jgi:hypothetical protein